MIISGHEIHIRGIVDPALPRTNDPHTGFSYGKSLIGWDVRIKQDITLEPGGFAYASIMERLELPKDVAGFVHDKSSWARLGLSVFNTVIEPGWYGFLTIELANTLPRRRWWEFWKSRTHNYLEIRAGSPIAQIVFHATPMTAGYDGKYQDQPDRPVPALRDCGSIPPLHDW